jgi:hypothetical protein
MHRSGRANREKVLASSGFPWEQRIFFVAVPTGKKSVYRQEREENQVICLFLNLVNPWRPPLLRGSHVTLWFSPMLNQDESSIIEP